ncbi:hypothetical protein VTH06DRAFT_2525 [Thermothelomyces fergusii]
MMHPPIFVLGLASLLCPLSSAHTTFTTLFINDVNQGDGTCIRMAKEGNVATHPLAGGLDSEDMACGRDGQEPVAFTCPAPAGAKLTFEFRMWADASQPGSIDPSHLGAMAIYLKKVSNMKSDAAAGPGWFKIWDQGYDTEAKKWATENLIENNGLLSVNLPSGLSTGYYLVRQETITFQNVTNDMPDPQFYVGCAQLYVEGTSDSPIPPDKTVSIPGHISDPADPGLTFNIYTDDVSAYKPPGPEVYFPTAITSSGSSDDRGAARQQTPADKQAGEGLVPTDCVVKNANWCAAALPPYTDEAGCWAAVEDCNRQLDECYTSAPPSGSRGCKIWEEQVCIVVSRKCEARDFQPLPRLWKDLREGIDEQIPGGRLPPALNAGESGDHGGRGCGHHGGEEEAGAGAASTPAFAAPHAARIHNPNFKRGRRRESRWRRLASGEQ